MTVSKISKCPVIADLRPEDEPYSKVFTTNPANFFEQLRQQENLCQITMEGNFPVWLITKFDDAQQVLKDPRFTKVPADARDRTSPTYDPENEAPIYRMTEENMLSRDAPEHSRLRSLVQSAFAPRYIQGFRARIQQVADELLDKIQAKGTGQMDFVEEYAYPLPIVVLAELLGLPHHDREKLRIWSEVMMELRITDSNRQALEDASIGLRNYLKEVFVLRREQPGDDLVTALLEARNGTDKLSEEELYAMVFLLIVAGHETTAHLLGNSMYTLLANPDQLAMLRNDPALIVPAVDEMLRHSGPVLTSTMRRASTDIVWGGVTMKEGDGVLVVLSSANMDATKFTDPQVFDIKREYNKHIAFGFGAHFCIGASLARLEAEIAIAAMLQRFPDLQFDPAVDVLEWRNNMLIRGLRKLPLVF
ncbi:cytochrome P450 family protein [Chitinophaga nivalis]|uniref:Cytochrome P450 n=1 Tax=Chitinophaga nivalis TaxID=2991709 RepID=A0ABT3IPB5_9BACT|nr:cytochrome P450 [Chitinophaga nivalis]MCW3464517.1 cytochrome P450 [Chitinophaga nivalis]MCW3485792.1 cytochrome P450 [Chitinophaga nivalis]